MYIYIYEKSLVPCNRPMCDTLAHKMGGIMDGIPFDVACIADKRTTSSVHTEQRKSINRVTQSTRGFVHWRHRQPSELPEVAGAYLYAKQPHEIVEPRIGVIMKLIEYNRAHQQENLTHKIYEEY